MNAVLLVSLLCTLACCCAATSDPDFQSQYEGCLSSAQCGAQHCCVLVKSRYPTTRCEPLRQLGQQCRPPSDRPLDTTLSYPGGSTVSVTSVHESLCPCGSGSVCSTSSGVCVTRSGNHLH